MTETTHTSPLRVVIVGGGIAALETVLTLHELAAGRVHMTLIAPEPDFVLRPMAVAVPFSRGHVGRLPLATVMQEHGGRFVRGAVAAVDADAHCVRLTTGSDVDYDILVLAPGASTVPAFLHALTFGAHPTALSGILADLEQGWSRSVAFIVPPGCTWSLPLYELALMTAEDVWSMNIDDAEVHLVTPERAPLELFGAQASAAVAELLAAARIRVHCGVSARIPRSGCIELGPGGELAVDCAVALPLLEGPEIDGIPSSARGFVPVAEDGAVDGLRDVYAVGDASDRPIKQGGLACQQAEVTAARIAWRTGADVVVPRLAQVLHGRLLTGNGERFLRREPGDADGSASSGPLAWAPAKVSGRHLAPYLIDRNIVHAVARGGATATAEPGIEVFVALSRQEKREHPDVLGLSPLGLIAPR